MNIRTDEGWAVLDAGIKTVNILFRGSQEDLRALELAPIRVELDVRKMFAGVALCAFLGLFLFLLVVALERYVLFWHESADTTEDTI